MNALCGLIERLALDETRVMNCLQGEAGLASDNCVRASDVAEANCPDSCAWVLENYKRLGLGK